MKNHRSLLAATCLLAACAAPPPERPVVEPPTPPPAFAEDEVTPPVEIEAPTEAIVSVPRDEPLGMVAGIPLTAEELLEEWYQVAPREVWLLVDKLVAVRLALVEAKRLGLTVSDEEVEQLLSAEQSRLAADVERDHPGMTVAEFLAEVVGQDPERYLASLRQAIVHQLLVERVVRGWVLANDNATLRMIVVPQGDMETILGFLEKGEDFAEVARVHSVDDSASNGGLVPFVVRQTDSPLTRAAFEIPVGEMGGPLMSGAHELLFRVESRRDALPEVWTELEPAVLESLAREPVTDAEFLHWKLSLERQYPIDMERLREVLGAR